MSSGFSVQWKSVIFVIKLRHDKIINNCCFRIFMESGKNLETIAMESKKSQKESRLYSCVQVFLHPIKSYRNVKEGVILFFEICYGSTPCEGAFFIEEPRNEAPY